MLCFLLLSSGCNGRQEQAQKKTPEELRNELLSQERNSPLDYLTLEAVKLLPQTKKVRNATLFKKAKYEPDGVLIQGYVNNKATLATFKDVSIKVIYYSKTNAIIGRKAFTLYEYYKPNSITEFTVKDYPPEGWTTFNVVVLKAEGN